MKVLIGLVIWLALGMASVRAAESLVHASAAMPSAREREYIAALTGFFRPGQRAYQVRVQSYSDAMATLYRHHPQDVDAGAFYALSLLAAESPDDTSLAQERRAMEVRRPLFAAAPDNPGLVHYIIHACDTPSLAAEGLAAADHYGEIAGSGPHAADARHMRGI